MHTVALVIFDQISPFEMAVPCEVFGTDRSDMGMPNYRLIACAVEEGPLRTKAGFTVEAPYDLSKLREADTIVVPAWPDIDETPPAALLEALRRGYARGRGSPHCVREPSFWPLRACSTVDERRPTGCTQRLWRSDSRTSKLIRAYSTSTRDRSSPQQARRLGSTSASTWCVWTMGRRWQTCSLDAWWFRPTGMEDRPNMCRRLCQQVQTKDS